MDKEVDTTGAVIPSNQANQHKTLRTVNTTRINCVHYSYCYDSYFVEQNSVSNHICSSLDISLIYDTHELRCGAWCFVVRVLTFAAHKHIFCWDGFIGSGDCCVYVKDLATEQKGWCDGEFMETNVPPQLTTSNCVILNERQCSVLDHHQRS